MSQHQITSPPQRQRTTSLTLPTGNISAAFGNTLLSWEPAQQISTPTEDLLDIHEVTRTLDYLGLAEDENFGGHSRRFTITDGELSHDEPVVPRTRSVSSAFLEIGSGSFSASSLFEDYMRTPQHSAAELQMEGKDHMIDVSC